MSPETQPDATPKQHSPKPIALVVLLENVGHVAGVQLPRVVRSAIDYLTEEYAKILLRYYGAYRVYDHVTILEDELATGAQLSSAILHLSKRYSVDLLLLVHGQEGKLVGHLGEEMIGSEMFDKLLLRRLDEPGSVDLRMVFGLNCYGTSLVASWQALGATVVNGTPGVNWLPEPSLSVFLRNWLRGQPYSVALERSNSHARRWGRRLLRNSGDGSEHPMVASSRQIIYGEHDITIHSRPNRTST